jgi:acetyl coenzyme A synthetase (ADP forming)-like protein
MSATHLLPAECQPPNANDLGEARLDGLRTLLAPRSIAVIGASRQANTIGHQMVRNLVAFGFSGGVYPINPRASSVGSVPAFARIAEVPVQIDAAVVVVPKEHVVAVAEECGAAGVRGLIVVSAGFREVGADGAARERALVDVVRRYGMRMVGPNCLGIINADPAIAMNATFSTVMPPFGHAAFVSQSGALGVSVLDSAREYGIGISQFVSVGNKPDVSGNDLLAVWEDDASVKTILMYVENFGNPRRFLELASRITKTKPIIVVKSGRSRAGARAASSHTGALAVSDVAVDALLAQAGVMRASTIEELFDMAMAFETRVLPRSRRTAVLTNAGGPGIIAADALDGCGLDIVDLAPPTVERLRLLFPAEASIRNPLDMIASATPTGYEAAMTALLADPAVDAVVPIFVPPFGIKQEDVADAIRSAAASAPDKPVLAVLMGREGLPQGRAELHDAGIPAYVFPESAARSLATLNRHVEWARKPLPVLSPLSDVDHARARRILEAAKRDRRDRLTQIESLALLDAYGITTASAKMATNADDAVRAARSIGFPVVMKLVSPDVVHKTDIGGVRVNLTTETEVRTAHDDIIASAVATVPNVHITGVLLQRMVPDGIETIVGLARDPSFGPLVMFGLGGVFVEAVRDVVFRIAPVASEQAIEMVTSIRGVKLLRGLRRGVPADENALAEAIRRVSQLAVDYPQIGELDINPLSARSNEAVALDARVSLRAD